MCKCRRVTVEWILLVVMSMLLFSCGSDKATSAEPVAVVEVFNGFEYYGPCGNETLAVDGMMLYPLLSAELAALDVDQYPSHPDELSEQGLTAPLRVSPPGPGDDTGTLLLYEDGMARFESDNGHVSWLSDEQRTYEWEC